MELGVLGQQVGLSHVHCDFAQPRQVQYLDAGQNVFKEICYGNDVT